MPFVLLFGAWRRFFGTRHSYREQGFHIENKAGVEKQQAVPLRVNADFVALHKCSIIGYKNTLYVHSFRQFYQECDIWGTIDFIFGNATVVFEACTIISKMPMSNQFTVVTAQSRDSPNEYTRISFQNCSIVATTNDLDYNSTNVKSYLGRPKRMYSRTVYLESYIGNFIDPAGWRQWSDDDDDQELDTLYYGEYNNCGPGSSTDDRVTWPGYPIMNSYDAINFTVSEFITGVEWLASNIIPCDF
ncbi:putative pectinesterase/pectinesterase inhibitor 12 [Quercus suber]|uniref:Pectinesterase n=1 Tax=Quercus suber TaxID=58331 RepID=A0AAW0L0T6_QUESU